MKWLALCCLLASCKERGTLAIDLTLPDGCPDEATEVRVHFVRNGSCSTCDCASCACTDPQVCLFPDCGMSCSPDAPIEFDPPTSGRYAAIYQFFRPSGDARTKLAVFCTEVVVDADGTASSSVEPTAAACCVTATSSGQ